MTALPNSRLQPAVLHSVLWEREGKIRVETLEVLAAFTAVPEDLRSFFVADILEFIAELQDEGIRPAEITEKVLEQVVGV